MSNNKISSVISNIRTHVNALSASEKRVADYVMSHRADVVKMSMMEIANTVGVSDATVLRFVRTIGCENFSSFKTLLAAELMIPNEAVFENISPDDSFESISTKVILSDIDLLQEMLRLLDPEKMDAAVNAILQAKNIYLFSVASSESMAVWLYDRLFRLGYSVISIADTYRQLVQASQAKPGDLFIAVSRSGSPTTIAEALHCAKRNCPDAKVLSIVCDVTSIIAAESDICLCAISNEIRTDISGSIVPMMSLLNCLYTCIEFNNIEYTMESQRSAWEALSFLRGYHHPSDKKSKGESL